MTSGRVQCFFPAMRCGVVRTDNGKECLISFPDQFPEVHGGDVIEFETGEDGKPVTHGMKLRQRWADTLNEQYRPLVNAFHQTIQIHA